MTTPATETLLTIEQAAAILAVNERMIRRLIETRRIAFVKVGRHVRFRERDLASGNPGGPTNKVVTRHQGQSRGETANPNRAMDSGPAHSSVQRVGHHRSSAFSTNCCDSSMNCPT
ncbi:MAG: excisionase family DNA-binding protein [Actinobacteria bacterium]|uniref:Unannotated protein n=1 Tax=freshwater metagenome TaxID=449393 RepID=A0A6J7LKD0_9ZZZZ|nr:excisionase family DNA-binding protein [Actinomycetota bacterium]